MDRTEDQPEGDADAPGTEEDTTPLAWEARVFAIALVFSIPGALFAALVALAIAPTRTNASGVMILGGLLGAIAGGLLEADYWP